MKKIICYLFALNAIFLLSRCSNESTPGSEDMTRDNKAELLVIEQQKVIEQKNEEAWANAKSLRFSDSDFLQTKEPMSDNAIAPYDYQTGLVGDKAYNNVVYIKALERAKKKLIVKDDTLVLNIKSGKDINIAEDLYQFIAALVLEWNQFIKEGRFKIIRTQDGYYDIAPIISDKVQMRSSPVNLLNMSDSQRWNAIKSVVDSDRAIDTYIQEHFMLNFNTSTFSGEYRDNGKRKRYSVSDGCGTWGIMDPNCIYNYIATSVNVSDALFYIYSLRNTNHQSLASYQLEK